MAKNEFLPFATNPGANVMSQEQYELLARRLTGFTSGMALSEQLNKVWRQSSFVIAALAQFMSDRTGEDVLDDGDQTRFLNQLSVAIFQGLATEAQLQAHIDDTNNPHQVTPGQIGAATQAALQAHVGNTNNPHQVTAAQIGAATTGALNGHVNNTNNPHQVTLAQLGGAPLNSPGFTGNPTAPTPALGDDDSSVATTAFVQATIASGYTGSRGPIGWRREPDGTIVQWGRIEGSWTEGTGPNITFPIAFPNECENVSLTNWNRSGGGAGQWTAIDCFGQVAGDPSTTGFGTFVQNPGSNLDYWTGCFWEARGY